ncbi:L-2,4-diaminobutyrate decarboxylase [Sinobacterium caligoides]|uniref:L-2,4-diaminobutyrate decarboxylase n=1 Tax=Sinobacterium caligoides TaxID=933926 RepID=A0A3N2DKC2_9GAMM|nr:aspartate aminotransferase family protein [Sinobacterium caligoides]ROS00237.1 L-2,4-diaminobutyrate decarboxylase [Sinobacterium caligoides]
MGSTIEAMDTETEFLSEKQAKQRPSAKEFVFNEHQLSAYEEAMQQGISLVQKTIAGKEKPFTGILPHELAAKFSDIDLSSPLDSINDALAEVDDLYLQDAVYFHHPKYVAHLNCPVAYPAILAELILSSINSSVDTWDQSAGATLIEQKLIDWSCFQIGLGDEADGIFTSGGTQSNLMALLLARDHFCSKHFPEYDIKHGGLPASAQRIRIFTSSVSHFSVQKAAAILGLGYDAVISIDCDQHFTMDSEALEQAINQAKADGLLPMAVIATAGTTDFGSIDPLHSIADLCDEHDLWMHTDAAYGCGLLASKNQRHLLSGIERSQSVTVDFHKSFLQPVSCSALLTRNKKNLGVVTHHAEYLNPLSAREQGTPNLVDKSLQTTRRFDALKLWLTLRTAGIDAIGEIFDKVCETAASCYLRMLLSPSFEPMHLPQMSTLVFRYIPSSPSLTAQHTEQDIDDTNAHIREALFRSGQAVVAGTKIGARRYLKITLLNPETTLNDIDEILTMIKQLGDEYLQSIPQTNSDIIASNKATDTVTIITDNLGNRANEQEKNAPINDHNTSINSQEACR